MSVKTKMNVGIHCIYQKYGKNMMNAHQALLNLENTYKNRSVKDNKIVEGKILKIIEGISDDN